MFKGKELFPCVLAHLHVGTALGIISQITSDRSQVTYPVTSANVLANCIGVTNSLHTRISLPIHSEGLVKADNTYKSMNSAP